jgi:hypothetical protein
MILISHFNSIIPILFITTKRQKWNFEKTLFLNTLIFQLRKSTHNRQPSYFINLKCSIAYWNIQVSIDYMRTVSTKEVLRKNSKIQIFYLSTIFNLDSVPKVL